MHLYVRICLALLLSLALPAIDVRAQSAPRDNTLKEVEVAANAFSRSDPVPPWVDRFDIPDGDRSQPVSIRVADTQFRVGATPAVYVRRALLVNDPASLSAVGQFPIHFVPEYQRIQLHTILVLRGQETLDRTATSDVRFLQRETGLERGVYSGEVTASILISDLRVGDTLVVAYTRLGQNPVFGDKFTDMAGWDQGLPTMLRRVALSHPADRRIAWRLIGSAAKPLTPVETTDAGTRKLVFEERSMPRVDVEPLTPPDQPVHRTLQFSEFSSWSDVAAWAGPLFKPEAISSPELRQLIDRLRKAATDEERAIEALAFVQSQIRYFSVSLGESSHRPTQPDIVLQRRYGDCKDKSLLLIALLEEVGITGRPVLLQAGRRRVLREALPSPTMFDHVIVQVTLGGRTYYLDPTLLGQQGKLRGLGQLHEATQVLVVAKDTREIATITTPNVMELALSEVTETASLPEFGKDAQLHVKQVWRGASAERYRVAYEQLPRAVLVKSIADAMQPRYPGSTLLGEPGFHDDRTSNLFTVTASYKVPGLATEREGNWYVRFLPTNLRGSLSSPPSPKRTAPLFQPAYPSDARYSFEIKLPETVRMVADPLARTIQNSHFKFTATLAFRGNVAKSSVQLQVLADRVEVADLAKYSEDLQAVSKTAIGVIWVPKSAIRSVSAKAAPKKDFAQLLHDRLQDTVTKTTAAIKSGKLSGSDLTESYCLRVTANSDLGRFEEALADANAAVAAAPASSRAFHCRGYAFFGRGEFDRSVEDYSKSLALGDTDGTTFHQRGIARFYAARLAEAAEDFAKASDARGGESQAYSDLWLAWTLQRLGRPLPEELVKRAALHPRGDWPRPALAVAAGHLPPEDMLKQIAEKSGDNRTMAYAEGYFYLGQHYLALGDAQKAREYFAKTRQLKVLIYTEHTAAGHELKRLGVTADIGEPAKAAEPKAVTKKTTRRATEKGAKSWADGVFKQ